MLNRRLGDLSFKMVRLGANRARGSLRGRGIRKFDVREFLLPLIGLVSIAFAYGRELYPGQYAQVPPEIQEWFRSQKIPGTEGPCCSQADGVQGEQDVRNGKYWTRFIIEYRAYDCTRTTEGGCVDKGIKTEQIGWIPVPDNVVIRSSKNPYLNPIIWWYREEGTPNSVHIRCYVPAAES
jgi:hypothetical protein